MVELEMLDMRVELGVPFDDVVEPPETAKSIHLFTTIERHLVPSPRQTLTTYKFGRCYEHPTTIVKRNFLLSNKWNQGLMGWLY